jgi:hypothetical protein
MSGDINQHWYILERSKRLIMKYMFLHDGDDNGAPDPEYGRKFAEFLRNNNISSDKIYWIEHENGSGLDIVHVYADGGIEQYALVQIDNDKVSKEDLDQIMVGMEAFNNRFVFLGEIPNMPGHCVVAEYATGKLHCGMHTQIFKAIET